MTLARPPHRRDISRGRGPLVAYELDSCSYEPRTGTDEAHDICELAFAAAPIATAIVLPEGRFIKVNPALCKLAARDESALLAASLQQITHPQDLHNDDALIRFVLDGTRDHYCIEKRLLRPTGDVVWALVSVAPVRDRNGTPRWLIVNIVDITASKITELRLRHQASHDPLTELWNRARLHEEIDRYVAEHRRYQRPATLMLIDLDGFKAINDTYGHDAGDQHLRAVASTITLAIRDSDRCGRLGERILAAIAAIPGPNGQPGITPASLGIAVLGGRIQAGHSWLLEADRAMYHAKRASRSQTITTSASPSRPTRSRPSDHSGRSGR